MSPGREVHSVKHRQLHILGVAALAILPLAVSCTASHSPVTEQETKDVVSSRWPSDADSSSVRQVRTVAVTPPAKPEKSAAADQAKPLGTPQAANVIQASLQSPQNSGSVRTTPPPRAGLAESRTEFEHFAAAPFPYKGEGLVLPSGRVLRNARSYTDDRVLMHIPAGFDINQPAVMVVFFHGHRAELKRDVLERQQVPAQISMSNMNAVLVAPQFAVDAAD